MQFVHRLKMEHHLQTEVSNIKLEAGTFWPLSSYGGISIGQEEANEKVRANSI
jgi:hypothetical protein